MTTDNFFCPPGIGIRGSSAHVPPQFQPTACGIMRDSAPNSVGCWRGWPCFFLTLASPMDALADGYLFSAHMLQHLLLLLVVPPLILLSLLPATMPGCFQNGRCKWVSRIVRHPVATWCAGRWRNVALARAHAVQCRRDQRVDSPFAICLPACDGLRFLVADPRPGEPARLSPLAGIV